MSPRLRVMFAVTPPTCFHLWGRKTSLELEGKLDLKQTKKKAAYREYIPGGHMKDKNGFVRCQDGNENTDWMSA